MVTQTVVSTFNELLGILTPLLGRLQVQRKQHITVWVDGIEEI